MKNNLRMDFTKVLTRPWTTRNEIANLNVINGALVGEVTGSPAYILAANLNIPVTDARYIEIRMRGEKAGLIHLYFTTTTKPAMTWAARLPYKGNDFETLRFDIGRVIGFNHDLTQLRIDLFNDSDTKVKFEITNIRILRE